MNNITNIMTNNMNNIHFDICHFDQLLEISASVSTSTSVALETSYYLEIISVCIATIVGLLSMLYNFLVKKREKRGLRLHFVGIARPKNFNKSQYKLLENINTDSTMVTLQTSLKSTDEILKLKQILKKTYKIPNKNDLLILYSHHTITDNMATLQDYNIANNSLLTLAICDQNKVIPPLNNIPEIKEAAPEPPPEEDSDSESESEYTGDAVNAMFEMYADYESETEPVNDTNELFDMFADYDSDSENEELSPPPPPTWPRPGFDIITQESNVLVHRMPSCGHEMNCHSLYTYALSTFTDKSNMHLKCPHNILCDDNDKLCDTAWHYSSIIDVLQYEDEKNHKWQNYARLELLSSRNVIENDGNFQKCPRCESLYFKNVDANNKALDEIKTVQDIENEFKFKCALCPQECIQIMETKKIKIKKEEAEKGHNEDEIVEDIDGNDVNAMFAQNYDSDSEDESDDENEALDAINHMFDGDGIDYIEEENVMIKYLNEFCFCCGLEWGDGHICDSSFKSDLCEILLGAETKTVGSVGNVPSIRCCPNCCQLIFHVDACKHMQCRGCKTDFCFVCMKARKDGKWQCGSYTSACAVAPKQSEETLPDTIVITKKSFQLY